MVALVCVAAAVVFSADPFGGAGAASIDNGVQSSFATVTRRALSSRTQADATLSYAGASTVVSPAGTPSANVQQAQQSLASAQTALRSARHVLDSDRRTLQLAQATLTADRARQASDCRGDAAAAATSASATDSSSKNARPSQGSPPAADASSACADSTAATAAAEQTATAASQKVLADQGQVASAQTDVSGAGDAAATAERSETIAGAGSTYTALPATGAVIRRGATLYAVDDRPALLLYGRTPAWRTFRRGMSPGRDVAELNANLAALGYGRLAGGAFTDATEAAILALQSRHGLARTGVLPLGSVVFEVGPVRVTSLGAALGQPVGPGPVLAVTSLAHQVTIELDVSDQTYVKVGDRVTVTLPDNRTTPGVVTSVGTVATAASGNGSTGTPASTSNTSSGAGGTNPTIEVDVRLLHEEDAGRLDQAPVQVSIITATARDALVVPVDALLALTGGGYALEVADATGGRHLEAVDVGLFDDAEGLVQVSGPNVRAGQRVVVPSS